MSVSVGNLLRDPEAQSFISLADADAYLAPEARTAWTGATDAAREAALVSASRWLAGAFGWRRHDLGDDDLRLVGFAAARLAVDALTLDLHASEDMAGAVKRERVGPVEVEYRDRMSAQAAGRRWPWLVPMLGGLVQGGAMRTVRRA